MPVLPKFTKLEESLGILVKVSHLCMAPDSITRNYGRAWGSTLFSATETLETLDLNFHIKFRLLSFYKSSIIKVISNKC